MLGVLGNLTSSQFCRSISKEVALLFFKAKYGKNLENRFELENAQLLRTPMGNFKLYQEVDDDIFDTSPYKSKMDCDADGWLNDWKRKPMFTSLQVIILFFGSIKKT